MTKIRLITVEDRRNILEAQGSGLGDEAAGERKLDGRLGEERESTRRGCGADDGRAERVLKADRGKSDADARRIDECRGQGERQIGRASCRERVS